MIKTIRSKALKLFWTKGDASKLPVPNHDRVRQLLAMLDAVIEAEHMNLPGFGFHGLHGTPKRYAVKASANYRITFGFDVPDAVDVDLEDYH